MKHMPSAKSSGTLQKKMRPALTPEARENQLIALATDLVEQRLRDGTATSQETTHFLKLATTKYKLEVENLELQKELTTAKTESIRNGPRIDELYQAAINAVRKYGGHPRDVDDE